MSQTNYAAQGTQRALEFEALVQQAAGRYDPRAAEDADEAAWLAEWQRTHPQARKLTLPGVLTVIACALVGIVFGVIVVAELLGPRW